MFTGIIESLGKVVSATWEDENLHLRIQSSISSELKIDQSVSHNGVCLTVVAVEGDEHVVTAIKETIDKSAVSDLVEGDVVNLERAMKLGDRLDGHIVQGHVDTTAVLQELEEEGGSWRFRFEFEPDGQNMLVEKGSITVDGTSLTVVDAGRDAFSVAIIPYTYEHTRFRDYKAGDRVNLEFDMIGKYVQRLMAGYGT